MENKNFDYGFLIKFKKGIAPQRRKQVRESLIFGLKEINY